MPDYPKLWDWKKEAPPQLLSNWTKAPDSIGFYELGLMQSGFQAMYGGKAIRQTLRERLRQHWTSSHNHKIKENRKELWFRCKSFKTRDEVDVVEGLHIIAFEYPWNQRNEWKQHWALEDF